MKRFQYYKTAAVTPPVAIGDPEANAQAILDLAHRLPADTQLAVFPELCISGYTCQDLFYEQTLLDGSLNALIRIKNEMPENLVLCVGLPLVVRNKLYNCAAVLFDHTILGIQVKTFIPAYNEYYETRWFSSADELDTDTVVIDGEVVPISNQIVFEDTTTGASLGLEICEDLWVSIPMSSCHALAGANILCNLSASNDVIAKKEYRRQLVIDQSARSYAGYVYASAGTDESSSDLVFSGHDLIAESGTLLAEAHFTDPKEFIIGEIDLQHLINDRIHFKTSMQPAADDYIHVPFASKPYPEIDLTRRYDAYPFVPRDEAKRIERCQNILHIQAQGLATRLRKIHCKDVVIGISGGLDSTLALLVCHEAYRIDHLDVRGIHAVTMPGFGTTHRTKSNAQQLMDLLGVSSEEITIGDAVEQHFADIHHDPSVHDITYENSQARERTQILMDLANQYNGFVVGTGDLSELALGWCTYNGDHMSMYAVNVSVPKTLVRYIVESQALRAEKAGNQALHDVLTDICDTPVSPELLPPDKNGEIKQKTEEVLGSYDLHDFFLYHMLRYHEEPEKIYALALQSFPQISDQTIKNAIQTFYRRFFAQQFKRNCMPDGVKVGSICFSPRGDWRMPSDASRNLWLKQAENL
ncbi:MAG: NAD(+) synthase [Catenisphaera adipataccumulans]|jgi:NAD+ synthase (glutamine-hydrolysing)|uniref:NAD(+) synthase n=1 Tax=Catenisphaera adipataccumulans TaxID=700500 RepID=UPI003D8E6AF2